MPMSAVIRKDDVGGRVKSGNDADRITTAFEEAEATSRPVAVLIGDEYHGFNRMNLDQEREQVLQQRGS